MYVDWWCRLGERKVNSHSLTRKTGPAILQSRTSIERIVVVGIKCPQSLNPPNSLDSDLTLLGWTGTCGDSEGTGVSGVCRK